MPARRALTFSLVWITPVIAPATAPDKNEISRMAGKENCCRRRTAVTAPPRVKLPSVVISGMLKIRMDIKMPSASEAKPRPRRMAVREKLLKQLQGIPSPYKEKIAERINLLAVNPRPFGCEKLTNRENEYRIRVGSYKVVYSIFDKILLVDVINVDDRKQVYR